MKIAVVGGGIFGVSVAWLLAKNNYSVDLYEKERDILLAASGINQYRLHRGYHYPRSKETALLSIEGEKSFRREYNKALFGDKLEHYYSIAKRNSFVTADQCLKFWDSCNLKYEKVNLDLINKEKVEVNVKVEEDIFDPEALRKICWDKLKMYKVNVMLNTKAKESDLENYDLTIIATYSLNNSLLHNYPYAQREYQFELCEKPVLKLPEKFNNKSFVVIDGPFMCIAPFGRSGMFVMGHVVHALHHISVGKLPEVPQEYRGLMNKGVVKNPTITNIEKFIESGSEFFPDLKFAEHVGSMFTVRTVPPYREYDDARPTFVEKVSEKVVSVFSGKIGTCIDVAEQVIRIANNINKGGN
ncbi:FAD-binding oxidoreductase [Candidatus Woesearchaeota archaeon]|nr:FAD-binding oxidoreductase [Candidatus Woesearchaeota archaeon]